MFIFSLVIFSQWRCLGLGGKTLKSLLLPWPLTLCLLTFMGRWAKQVPDSPPTLRTSQTIPYHPIPSHPPTPPAHPWNPLATKTAHFTIFDFLIYGFNFLSNLPIAKISTRSQIAPGPVVRIRIHIDIHTICRPCCLSLSVCLVLDVLSLDWFGLVGLVCLGSLWFGLPLGGCRILGYSWDEMLTQGRSLARLRCRLRLSCASGAHST